MKYFFLFALLNLLAFKPCFAQITITRANMPVAGDQFIFSTTNDRIDVKSTGKNHIWDFSKLQPASNDTFIFKKPADIAILFALAFNGTVGLKEAAGIGGQNAFSFFRTSGAAYTQAGYGINAGVADLPIKFTDEDEIYNFPLTFNRNDSSSFAANTAIPGYGSIKIKGTRVSIVDGWGKITTPYKTYNCIRVRSIVREIDSIAGQGFQNDRIEIKWLALEEKVPVLQVTGSIINGQFVQQTVQYRDIYRNIVNPNAPKPAFAATDTIVMVKDTVVFKNSTQGLQNQYLWTFTPNSVTFISGTSATSPNPQVVFNAKGKYTVSLSAQNFVGSNQLTKTDYIVVNERPAGIDFETERNLEIISVYPNPTSNGLINIVVPDEVLKEKSRIEVIDLQGRNIFSETINASNFLMPINLSNKPKGIYILNIISGTSRSTQKIIIE